MAFECKEALTRANVPDLGCVVKRAGKKLVPVCVEVQTYYFCAMTTQVEDFMASLDIPQFRCVVHRTSGHEHAVRVKQ